MTNLLKASFGQNVWKHQIIKDFFFVRFVSGKTVACKSYEMNNGYSRTEYQYLTDPMKKTLVFKDNLQIFIIKIINLAFWQEEANIFTAIALYNLKKTDDCVVSHWQLNEGDNLRFNPIIRLCNIQCYTCLKSHFIRR